MKILGKNVAKIIKDEIKENLEQLKDSVEPALVIIRVGEDPASVKYTNNKVKAAKECGILPLLIEIPDDIDQENFDETVGFFLRTDSVHGVIVQLPLPKHLNSNEIDKLFDIYYEKDVDGFSYRNTAMLHMGSNAEFNVPCTAKGCIDLIESTGYDIAGKVALVIGRSNIVGKPVARLLEQKNATVIQCHSKTSYENFRDLAKLADIVIVAIGKPHAYQTSLFPKATVFIDVGINVDENGKMVGDLLDDANVAYSEDRYITPVPGGVGPMTVTNLLFNTYKSYLKERG